MSLSSNSLCEAEYHANIGAQRARQKRHGGGRDRANRNTSMPIEVKPATSAGSTYVESRVYPTTRCSGALHGGNTAAMLNAKLAQPSSSAIERARLRLPKYFLIMFYAVKIAQQGNTAKLQYCFLEICAQTVAATHGQAGAHDVRIYPPLRHSQYFRRKIGPLSATEIAKANAQKVFARHASTRQAKFGSQAVQAAQHIKRRFICREKAHVGIEGDFFSATPAFSKPQDAPQKRKMRRIFCGLGALQTPPNRRASAPIARHNRPAISKARLGKAVVQPSCASPSPVAG